MFTKYAACSTGLHSRSLTNIIIVRLINSVARPWETRFEPIVTQIREHVRKIEKTAEVGHMITSAKTLEATHRLENGQTEISHEIQVLSQREEETSADVQAIRGMMEEALQSSHIIKDQSQVVHSNGQQPITVVQGKVIGI